MKALLATAILVVLALPLSSCNDEDGTYSYELNGCATGSQSYSSKEELCRKLKDENLNHGCARMERADRFAKDCPGQTFDDTTPVSSTSSSKAVTPASPSGKPEAKPAAPTPVVPTTDNPPARSAQQQPGQVPPFDSGEIPEFDPGQWPDDDGSPSFPNDGEYTLQGADGCTTGPQSFVSREEFCARLIDDAANHGCAREERQQHYEEVCGAD